MPLNCVLQFGQIDDAQNAPEVGLRGVHIGGRDDPSRPHVKPS